MGYLIASSLTASRLDFPSEIIPISLSIIFSKDLEAMYKTKKEIEK